MDEGRHGVESLLHPAGEPFGGRVGDVTEVREFEQFLDSLCSPTTRDAVGSQANATFSRAVSSASTLTSCAMYPMVSLTAVCAAVAS